ncbi:hypothetical protein G3A56_13175 [Rhizobium oryzihabitans]|uniref:Uncharacterized protein n=1 Tax=Rhizobium oryzihabitans TaxID=2267833 RepID=A0A7L5BJ02_9HYPH|nr:hypothetical protein [Rhizobium oryzihabitans]QIB38829.1 hypothetical protein G3A56_13175 [Rhizobium oryzihabitans]
MIFSMTSLIGRRLYCARFQQLENQTKNSRPRLQAGDNEDGVLPFKRWLESSTSFPDQLKAEADSHEGDSYSRKIANDRIDYGSADCPLPLKTAI